MAFWRRTQDEDAADSFGRKLVAGVAGLIFVLMLAFALENGLRANGLYGERTFATETVIEKRIDRARRNSAVYRLVIRHRGERLTFRVMGDEYAQVTVGQPLKVIVVPTRFNSRAVFLDRPGIKHDPETRFALFGLIIITHFGALALVFLWWIRGADRTGIDPSIRMGGIVPRVRGR
jgi:hypothetical protein